MLAEIYMYTYVSTRLQRDDHFLPPCCACMLERFIFKGDTTATQQFFVLDPLTAPNIWPSLTRTLDYRVLTTPTNRLNGSRTARLLFWIPDPVFKAQTWLVNPTLSRTRDQAIILARLAAVLAANRWSLRLRDRNAASANGVSHDSSILRSRWVSGLVVVNIFRPQ